MYYFLNTLKVPSIQIFLWLIPIRNISTLKLKFAKLPSEENIVDVNFEILK